MGALLNRQRDAVARAAIQFDDLLFEQLVFRVTINRAKYVSLFRSLMITRSTFAPSAAIRWPIRSCVRGRSFGVSLINIEIAAPTLSST